MVPLTVSLGLINLLQRPIELIETLDLLEHWFVLKGSNSGIATRRAGTGQVVGKAGSSHALSECTTLPKSPWIHHPKALRSLSSFSGFYGSFITQA